MIWARRYLGMKYLEGGRVAPNLDCWGLYRTIVADVAGVALEEFSGIVREAEMPAVVERERESPGWIRIERGAERNLDLVLMKDIVGDGPNEVMAPIHVGCMVSNGLMLDIRRNVNVRLRNAYEPAVRNRTVGFYRPRAIAHLPEFHK